MSAPRDARLAHGLPPPELRAFFARYRQTPRTLTNGVSILTPLFFWGDGLLALSGSVAMPWAIRYLSRVGKKPFIVRGPGGPMALAGLLSPSYSGSSAGPYRGFFFGLFVDDGGWDPARPTPGFQFIQFYDSTALSTAAGELWGLHKIWARIENDYAGATRWASLEHESRQVARMSWNVPAPEPVTTTCERRFHNFPESGEPGGRILVVGPESSAPFRPGIDQLSYDPNTKLGRVLVQSSFTARFWSFTSRVHGVYFLP
jgi:hypothetical protein